MASTFECGYSSGRTTPSCRSSLLLPCKSLEKKQSILFWKLPDRNALDFHIAYYLGVLASVEPLGFFHIISKDTGFDPLIQHLKNKKIFAARSASIEEMPCFAASLPATQQPKIIASQQKPNTATSKPTREELIKAAVDDLIRRKASKPRTPKTLWSTIHARCGKDIPSSDIDAVYEAIVEQGYVKVEGTRITYALPPAKP